MKNRYHVKRLIATINLRSIIWNKNVNLVFFFFCFVLILKMYLDSHEKCVHEQRCCRNIILYPSGISARDTSKGIQQKYTHRKSSAKEGRIGN